MNFTKRLIVNSLVAASMVIALLPRVTFAADANPAAIRVGPWEAVTLARDSDSWTVESYKASRDLVAWAELSVDGQQRRLYAWDGTKVTLLATVGVRDWYVPTGEEGFYDPTTSGYDAADGLVVWVQWDGKYKQIYAWDGAKTIKVTNNSFDSRHPITSRGAIAWTSQPTDAYNLTYRSPSGVIKVMDNWQVQNYVMSGDGLIWINRKGLEGFKVYESYKGGPAKLLGDGDDRPIKNYFVTDGQGAVAWEYSTKNWSSDRRVVWHSWDFQYGAYKAIERLVPPLETRLEDVSGRRIMYNVKDWAYQDLMARSMLIEMNDGNWTTVWRKPELTKVRYMDGGYVKPREISDATSNTSLVFRPFDGGEIYLGYEAVYRDRFEADGPAAAGARVPTGVIAFAEGKTTVIPTTGEVKSLDVKDGDIAWLEGAVGSQELHFATRTIWVGSAAYGPQLATGTLAKAAGQSAVYLLTRDGQRFAFQSGADYRGWYADYYAVRTLPASVINSYALAGSVLIKPGTSLVKSSASSRIFVMGSDGLLHWVTSAEVLNNQLGSHWGGAVEVLSPSVFANYRQAIYSVATDSQYMAAVNGTI